MTIAKALSPPPTLNTTLTAAADRGRDRGPASRATRRTARPARNAPTNNGPIIGQPIVLDTGANQEVVTVKRHISPLPAAPAPNVVLSAPLAKDHAAGTATTLDNVILSAPLTKAHATGVAVANPRPFISAAKATELRTLLADAKAKADARQHRGARSPRCEQFKHGGRGRAGAGQRRLGADRPAAGHAGRHDRHRRDGRGGRARRARRSGGSTTRRVPVANPGATYKILVNGRAGGFRHQSIVDFECDVPAARRRRTASTSTSGTRTSTAARAARLRPASRCRPARSWICNTLKQYKTIVFNSTVGLNGTSTLNAVEFANLQAFVRGGGGVDRASTAATDSMQNVPWYMDLVGAGFTNHGSNQGGILIETESGGHVEFVNADRRTRPRRRCPRASSRVEELYNTNRNPVEMGIVHPLVYENEDSLVGQIGYGTGALHEQRPARDGRGAATSTAAAPSPRTLGHNWQFTTETWFRR